MNNELKKRKQNLLTEKYGFSIPIKEHKELKENL